MCNIIIQTADWQVNKVNIVVNIALTDSLSLNFKSSKVCLRDRDSVKAFHNNVYLIILCQQSAFFRTLKNFFVLVEMTFGQVVASCSVPKWQLSCKTDFLCTL